MSDDRARVPFALAGVLLLVGSATLSASLAHRRLAAEPAVDASIERTSAAVRTALRSAVRTASRNAAARPVVTRANATFGRVLNASSPFEGALRVRIYLRTRERLRTIRHERGDVTTAATLAPTPNASALGRAKRRVHVEAAGPNGTRLRVRIENVSVTATRSEREVGSSSTSPTVVVDTPVLALHDRVTGFERRLNRRVDRPGFARQFTARLYPLAWTRGYVQHGGGPIDNVVANRHLELLANGALLSEQRRAFGRSDPEGQSAMAVATARVGLADLTTLAPQGPAWVKQIYGVARSHAGSTPSLVNGERTTPGASSTLTVGVNESADVAFRRTVADANFTRVLQSVYSAEVRLRATTRRVDGGRPPLPRPEGSNWEVAKDTATTTAVVVGTHERNVTAPDGWHVLASYGRRVRLRHERRVTWRRGKNTTTRSAERTETVRTTVAVVGRHAPTKYGPNRTIVGVHRHGGGTLTRSNLTGVRERAVTRLVDERGGPDALARRAARGRLETRSTTIEGTVTDAVRSWAYADLMSLRERIRNRTTTVERVALGSMSVNPASRLAAALRRNRSRFVAAPDRYRGLADRARAALRAAYLDRILADLQRRASRQRDRPKGVDESLSAANAGSLSLLRKATGAREASTTTTGHDGLRMTVNASPHYLTLTAVGHGRVPSVPDGEQVHPLVARNVNVATVPYGDVTDTIGGLFASPKRTRLRTAARALRAANRTLQREGNATLEAKRNRLRDVVASGTDAVESRLVETLTNRGVGESRTDARRVLDRALSRWETTADRALALGNGSAATAIVAEAGRVDPNATATKMARDRLRVAVEASARSAVTDSAVQPPQSLVNETTTAIPPVADAMLKDAVRHGVEKGVNATARRFVNATARRFVNETLGDIPVGIPLIPGYLFAWTNFWYVEVRGSYERLVVRTPRGYPGSDAGTIAYVREDAPVELDVDGDGRPERIGYNRNVSLHARTLVTVVVPAGKGGIGDKDGNWEERSAGWPTPGE